MAATLQEHHNRIRWLLADIQQICRQPRPDMAALVTARLRLSQASVARSRYVSDVLLPRIRHNANNASLTEISNMQRAFSLKRSLSSEHITTWDAKSIAADWDGYRAAAKQIASMMEDQMRRESQVFSGKD